jgi:hypothetical protein
MTQTFPLDWESALALVVLKSLRYDQVADVAGLAIENGFDTRTLRQLAGRVDDDELGPRHERLIAALRSAGVVLPRIDAAAAHLARAISAEVVAKKIDPMVAAHLLASLGKETFGHTKILDPFIYADSEFEDRPDERALFERMVIDAANVVLFGPDAPLSDDGP